MDCIILFDLFFKTTNDCIFFVNNYGLRILSRILFIILSMKTRIVVDILNY